MTYFTAPVFFDQVDRIVAVNRGNVVHKMSVYLIFFSEA